MIKKIFIGLGLIVTIGIVLFFSVLYTPDLSMDALSEYINEESEFLKLDNGATIHYRDEGNKDGHAIVLVHGGFGSLHNWEGWVPLIKNKYRVISLDLPAHGLTGGGWPGGIYTRQVLIDSISSVVDHLGVKTFSMAGNSLGGAMVLQYALDYPERVESLVLLNSGGIPVEEEGGYDTAKYSDEKIKKPGDPGYNTLTLAEKISAKFLGRDLIKEYLNSFIADKSMLTDGFIDRYYNIIRYQGNREANMLLLRQWIEPGMHPRDLEPRLKEINVPVLYQHGDYDELIPKRVAERFVRLLPKGQLQVYKDVGHMPMIEKPRETANDLLNFLGEVYE